MRNKIIIPIVLFFSLTLNSCFESIEPRYLVTIERDFDIPANLAIIPTHFFVLRNIPTFYEENLALNGLEADEVTTVFPSTANIQTVLDEVDWSFVEMIEIFALSQEDENIKRRIFFADQADFTNRSQVGLFNVLVDMKEFVNQSTMTLEVRLKTRAFVPRNINARVSLTYGVFDTE